MSWIATLDIWTSITWFDPKIITCYFGIIYSIYREYRSDIYCFYTISSSTVIWSYMNFICTFLWTNVVIIFNLRKIKIITSQYPGQNTLKYFPLSVLPRNLIRINFRIRIIMFLLIDKYMIQITLETKNYCLLVVIMILDGEYHYLYHQKHHITIMDLEWF